MSRRRSPHRVCSHGHRDVSTDLVALWGALQGDEQCIVLFALDALSDGSLPAGEPWWRYRAAVLRLARQVSDGSMSPGEVHAKAMSDAARPLG